MDRDKILPTLPESDEDVTQFRQESVQVLDEVIKDVSNDIDDMQVYFKPSYVGLKVKQTAIDKVLVEWEALLIGAKYNEHGAGFSKTLDINNDLDSGGEAVSTWYYIWAIAKSDGVGSCIFSASSDDPTLPSGYVHKRLISMVYNSAGGDFVEFYQFNKYYVYNSLISILNTNVATAKTLLNLEAFIPEKVYKHYFNYRLDIKDTGGENEYSNLNFYHHVNGNDNCGLSIYHREYQCAVIGYISSAINGISDDRKYHYSYSRSDTLCRLYLYIYGFEVEL